MSSRKFRLDHIHIGYMVAFVILVILEVILFSGILPAPSSIGTTRAIGAIMAICYALALAGEYLCYICNTYDSAEH